MLRGKKGDSEDPSIQLGTIREFLDAADAAIVLIDPEHEIGYLNEKAEVMWGQAVGRKCFDVLAGSGEPCSDCPLHEVLSQKAPINRQMRVRSGEGWQERENLYMYVTGPISNKPYMALVSSDYPRVETLKLEIERERGLSRALLESVNAIVVGFSKDGEVTFVNRAAERITGYSEADILAGSGMELLVPEEYRELAAEFFDSSPEEPRSGEAVLIPLTNRDGLTRMISWTYSPLRLEDGTLEGAIALGQDVSERFARRRRAEKLAEELLVVNTILARAQTATGLDEMLKVSLNAMLTLPGYVCGAAYRVEGQPREAVLVESRGFEKARPPASVVSRKGDFPTSALYRRQIEMRPASEPMHPEVEKAVEGEELRGVVSVPVIVADEPIGAILLGHRMEPGRAAEGLKMLSAAADAAELGAENAFLKIRSAERAREATSLLRAAQSLTGTLDLTAALLKVAAEAVELLQADRCNIWLLDDGTDMVFPRAGHDWTPADREPKGVPVSSVGTAAEARETLKPVIVYNAERDSRVPASEVREHGVKSSLVVPLVTEDRYTGHITVDMTSRRREFTQREADLMESLARQAATAVRNAQLIRELRESEERYRALAESDIIGIIVSDGEKLLYANDRALEMLARGGKKPQSLPDVMQAVVPEERRKISRYVEDYMAGREAPEMFDVHLEGRDGAVLTAQAHNRFITLGGHRVVMTAIVDITERVAAEEALRSSEERYRTLVESSRDSIIIADSQGDILFANSASVNLTGHRPEELIGKNVYSFVHPDERERVKRLFSREFELGRAVEKYPIRVVVNDEEKYFEANTAVLGEPGPSANIMTIVSDVTERERAQRMIAESEERYRTIVESSRDLIVVVNRAGEILYANQATMEIFGYDQKDTLRRFVFEFIHPDDRERAARDFMNDWKTGSTIPNYPLRAFDREGRIHHLETTSGLVGWPEPDAVQIFVVRDVTERRQRDEERELQLSVDEAMAAIAARFVEPEDVVRAINEALEGAGELLKLSRCFYMGLDVGPVVSELVEWAAEGIDHLGGARGVPSVEGLQWWVEQLREDGEAVFLSREEVTEQASAMADLLGPGALAVVGLQSRGEVSGLIGFSALAERRWSHHELNLLREMGRTISRALERAEWIEQLGRSERFRTRITESIGEGLLVLTNRVITWANSQACAICGYEQFEMIGMSMGFLMPHAGDSITSRMLDGLGSEGIFVSEENVLRKDSAQIDVVLTVTSLGVTEDGMGEVLVAMRDITEAKRMRQEVEAAAEAYSTIFASSGDALIVHKLDGEIIDVNERTCVYTGYTHEDLIGLHIAELVAENLRSLYGSRREEVLETGSTIFEVDLLQKDGGTIPVEATSRLTRIAGEQVVLASLRDMTERRKAEEETKRRTRQLASLNEIVVAATSSLDLETVARAILSVAIDVTGSNTGLLLLESQPGKGVFRSVATIGDVSGMGDLANPQARREALSEMVESIRASEIVNPGGAAGEAPTRVLLIPLRGGDRTLGLMALGSDEQGVFDEGDKNFYDAAGAEIGVSLENALVYREVRAEHERLSLLYRTSQGISGELDLESLLERTAFEAAGSVTSGQAVVALLDPSSQRFKWRASHGIDLELLKGADLGTEWGIGKLVMQRKRALVGSGENSAESAVLGDDPVAYFLDSRFGAAVPLISRDKVVGILMLYIGGGGGSLSDEDVLVLEAIGRQAGIAIENARLYEETRLHLEALESAHRELMVLDRMKSDFVSTVSHELRSPLAVIEGFAKTIVEHFDQIDRETERESIEIILKKSMALEGLIENILDMARIEEGRLDIFREQFELTELCTTVISDLVTSVEEHEVELDSPPEPVMVYADRDKTEVALGNLVRNALKFSPMGGTVNISVRRSDSMAEVSVADEGIGISEVELEKIFDRFYQVESGETRSYPGSGLGLYITKELVQAMDGEIRVESERGRGSVFSFTLPLAE
jgi:PAS domain S-box-containing protein